LSKQTANNKTPDITEIIAKEIVAKNNQLTGDLQLEAETRSHNDHHQCDSTKINGKLS